MSNLRTELKAELEAAGLFAYHPARVYGKAVLLAAVTAGFLGAFVVAPWWALKVPLFLAAVVTNIALAMIAHDSGHSAVSRNKLVNDLPGWALFPFFNGLSLPYWRHKHNTLHHSYTNVSGKDPDIDIFPFAMATEQKRDDAFRRFVQSHQGALFWPLTLFTTLAMRFDSFHFHATVGRKVCSRSDRRIDFACLAGHYTLYLVVPTLVFGVSFWAALAFYVAWSAIGGVLLAAIFLPAHIPLPFVRDYEDNFLLQLQTTQNLKTNPLFSFLLIGLDHQVEHHLFQRMSHLSAKKAAPIVKAFCERKGIPYQEQDWGEALVASTVRLNTLPDYEPLAMAPGAEPLREAA